MGRYINWDDVVDRYPEIDTLGDSGAVTSTYIVYAEAYTDGMLQSHFTPPFSSNNVVVRDLTIDCVYWRAGRHTLENAETVREEYFETIKMLKTGDLNMLDESGNQAGIRTGSAIYSTTASYHSSFGIDDPTNYMVDSGAIVDIQDARD